MTTNIMTRHKQTCPAGQSKGICRILRKRAETSNEKFWNNCVKDNDGVWGDINRLNQYCRDDFGPGSYYLLHRERRDCGSNQSKGMCKTFSNIDSKCPPGTIERLGKCYKDCPSNFDSTDFTCTKRSFPASCPPGKVEYQSLCYNVEPGKEIKSPGVLGPFCPEGSVWNGTSCYYDRGAGTIGDRCDPGSEEYAGLCYKANYDKQNCYRTSLCSIRCKDPNAFNGNKMNVNVDSICMNFSEDYKVYGHACGDYASQEWKYNPETKQIMNNRRLNDPYCITSKGKGNHVKMEPCRAGDVSQQFEGNSNGDRTGFRSVQNGANLDIFGGWGYDKAVGLYDSNGQINQRFYIKDF